MDEKEVKNFFKALREQTKKCPKTTSNPKPPVNHIPMFKEVSVDLEKYKIPNQLLPDPEWSHNLVQWFSYVRHDVNQLRKQKINEETIDNNQDKQVKNEEVESSSLESNNTEKGTEEKGKKKIRFAEIVQLIENGDPPTVDVITDLNDASGILYYFKKRNTDFTHSDLCWIFSALTRVNRLMNPEMCGCVQVISSIVKKQICEGGDKNSQLYPYLSVINDLIVKFFNQF